MAFPSNQTKRNEKYHIVGKLLLSIWLPFNFIGGRFSPVSSNFPGKWYSLLGTTTKRLIDNCGLHNFSNHSGVVSMLLSVRPTQMCFFSFPLFHKGACALSMFPHNSTCMRFLCSLFIPVHKMCDWHSIYQRLMLFFISSKFAVHSHI